MVWFIQFDFFIFGISLTKILTNSRAAWLGIILGVILIYGKKSLKFLIAIFSIISLFKLTLYFQIGGENIMRNFKEILPQETLEEFINFKYSRKDIWKSAFNTIISNPIFGTGASLFTSIYELNKR